MSDMGYTNDMGKVAVGVYLKTLREKHDWSQEKVAGDLGLSEKQVRRWEKGRADPASSSLVKLVRYVKGHMRHVTNLLLENDEAVASAIAKALAEEQYKITSSIDGDDERVTRAERIVDRLRTHPEQFSEWLGYGERIIDELPGSPQSPG